jgi:protein involved in polysaccharide export with SLBB domain
MRLVKSAFHFGFATMLLLLIAMAQATPAQQSANAPQDVSQKGCQQIAVFGAVRTPSRLDAPQRLRLLEVLGRVGGPNERAGKTVRIVHTCSCSPCDKAEVKAGDVNEYNLADVLHGRENGNPYVAPGDIVMVLEADSVFVMGNVIAARSIAFNGGMTVTRAIAMAGGVVGRGSDLVTLRIHRKTPDGTLQNPVIVRLKAILDGHAENVLLQPWDVVEVSDELGHFQVPRMSNPIWDPPLPKWDPPLAPRKDISRS